MQLRAMTYALQRRFRFLILGFAEDIHGGYPDFIRSLGQSTEISSESGACEKRYFFCLGSIRVTNGRNLRAMLWIKDIQNM